MPTLYITFALLTAMAAVHHVFAVQYFAHMFQLNGYKPGAQLRWMKNNRRWLSRRWIAFFGIYLIKPKKAAIKKPLVWTARMKRLYAVALLLDAGPLAASYLLWALGPAWAEWISVYALWIFFLFQLPLTPYLLLLANALNAPAEKAIRNHYTKEAVAKLRAHTGLRIVGITGSYGKTSMKYCLNALLRAKFNVFMTPEGTNTPMGIVRCVREKLSAAHEIFLCEMGAKNVGDIKELCDIARPQCGVLTSIGPQHLESFKCLENVVKTKFELADALPFDGPESILFANGEDENIRARLPAYPRAVTYAAGPEFDADYHAEDVACGESGVSFTAVAPGGERERFTTRLLGRHNVLNLMGAIAVAHTFGIPLAGLKGPARKLQPVPHRLELLDKGGGTLIIDDAYNSNPSGAKAALDTLNLFDGCMKILVTPGMIELGAKQLELNKAFGAQAAAVCDAIALVGEAQTRPIREGILEAGFDPQSLRVAATLQEALAWVYALPGMEKKKVILLENDLPDNF